MSKSSDFTALSDNRVRRLRLAIVIVLVLLGLLHAWAGRHTAGNDGISYLDMGDAYFRGDWATAINTYWSPFYAWLTGLALYVFEPSAYWEFPTVQAVDFLIYIFALCCFDYFLRQSVSLKPAAFPLWAWYAVGYSLFAWGSLELIGVSAMQPDMLMGSFAYLAAALLIRINRDARNLRLYMLLGVALGLGYLAKAPMFPMAIFFFIGALVSAGSVKTAWSRLGLASVIFLAIACPLIVAMSRAKGRLTWGDTARMNYAWRVSKYSVPDWHWQGGPPGAGMPLHSSRQIFSSPAVFEFDGPVGGTFPAWYDPTYWAEGLRISFDPIRQIKVCWRVGGYILSFFLGLNGSIAIGILVLFYVGGRAGAILTGLRARSFLLIPLTLVLLMYSLVHVEPRHIATFVVLVSIVLFSAANLPDSAEFRRLVSAIAIAVIVMFIISISPSAANSARSAVRDVVKGEYSGADTYSQVANELKALGLKPGDKIASLTGANQNNVFVARLARLRIISEVYYRPHIMETHKNNFWLADATTKQQVLQALQGAGAVAVLADEVPPWAVTVGWRRVGHTDYYVYLPYGPNS